MQNSITLSPKYQMILGSLLGDGYYNKSRKLIRFAQCDKQKEYLNYKYSFFIGENKLSRIYKREYAQGYSGYSFELLRDVSYRELYDFLDKNLYAKDGRKKISLKYLRELTPLSLAMWWMDDGCLSIHKGNRYGKLCTHCFNYEEHILIQKYFKEYLGVDVQIKMEKNKYYFIRLNVQALKKFIKIIYSYVIQVPSMIYKIDLNYKNNVKLGDFEDVYRTIQNAKHLNLEL